MKMRAKITQGNKSEIFETLPKLVDAMTVNRRYNPAAHFCVELVFVNNGKAVLIDSAYDWNGVTKMFNSWFSDGYRDVIVKALKLTEVY